ncbi:glycosyltransferase family 2 protein [Flavobacterium sp. LB3P21]|uniref:glycosyltransferase family 2 protein n=1 Tax=unclassified Flavobacterium TaxID=196869 RepID=UPI003AB04909
MFKLSIITINYNNFLGLQKTVESVTSQTWQEFEYIVIDGASTDGSKAYIESQNQHIDYWISEPDKGIYNAMNKGIAKATGEYLLFLNSGDHLYCEDVLKKNKHTLLDFDLITFDLKIIGQDTEKNIVFPQQIKFLDLYVSSYYSLLHPVTFIKKELFNTVGLYDEKYKIISDWKFFMLALFKFNCSYKKIEAKLTTFYLGGISSGGINQIERDKFLNEEFKYFIEDYDEMIQNQALLNSNRYKMLDEMESTTFGKKVASYFLRSYVVLFSRKKLKDIINCKVNKNHV